jgi:hypothetical protein
MLLWTALGLAAIVALAALARAQRLARRLEQLTELYWELRYDHGRLRDRVASLEPAPAADVDPAPPPPAQPAGFVPLSSLKQR